MRLSKLCLALLVLLLTTVPPHASAQAEDATRSVSTISKSSARATTKPSMSTTRCSSPSSATDLS